MPPELDLVVVGGGPAGLATAIACSQRGLRVAVLERDRPPIDRACGEGLLPAGVARLEALGVELAPGDFAPLAGIRFLGEEVEAVGRFGGPGGRGIRRTRLHAALAGRAETLGVDLRWGVTVAGLEEQGVRCGSEVVGARFVVGADGRSSRVRRWAGLDGAPPRLRRFGVRRHFRKEPWTDRVEMHWADGCEAYVTPVSGSEVGVALLAGNLRGGFDSLLGRVPLLARRLANAEATSSDRGAGGFGQRARAVSRGRLALAGDAALCLDAISGAGLSQALADAFDLVSAIEGDDLGLYRRRRRARARLAVASTALLLLLAEHPRLRRRAFRALRSQPSVFDQLLAVQAGMRAGAAPLATGIARLLLAMAGRGPG